MTIELRVFWIPKKYKDQEEDISIKMKTFFPKALEEGRLEVIPGACGAR